MRCSKCGTENPAGKKFCSQCGSGIPEHCPKCGAEIAPASRFCGDCGTPLAANAPIAAAQPLTQSSTAAEIRTTTEPPDASTPADGERKTVTALFADIKGSTELMQDLDPEEARAIIDPALQVMIDAARRYDGYIVQSTGDGIFALFGAPVAHEDHPQRALYAALRMQEEMRRYGDRLRGDGRAPLEIRVGVNTGEVVVRTVQAGGRAEYTPIGHTANLASRLQSLARSGSVVVAEPTRKLAEGFFQLKSLGAARLKGVDDPIAVFEVTGLGPLRTRLQAAAGRGLTRFVGRETELAQMRRALELVGERHGQIVAAIGEAGVGKSRLFFEFKALAQSGYMVLEAYSVSHGKASAYLPVLELLRDYFRIASEDDQRRRREKIAGKVVILDPALQEMLAYLFALLGIQEENDPLAQMDPQVKRKRTLDVLKRIVLRESLNQPLILVFEDLHWIDGETQEFLNLVADSIANARILLLVNYRPEYRHEWGSRTYYTQLRLDPLGDQSADEMLSALLGDGVQLRPLKREIVERTEGNPFFIEEIVQALFDEGVLIRNGTIKIARPLSQVRLPPTAQAVLAARIDRLPADEKNLLQTLAVIGREFPLGLIRRVAQCSKTELDRMLADLQLAEFIYEQPAIPDVEYSFKHALTQEVAYNSVLGQRRKVLHERAAAAIEEIFAGRIDDCLGELAHHYGHSANIAKAVEYLCAASEQALRRSHHVEAIAHATEGLSLLGRLPDTRDRLRSELVLQLAIGRAFFPVGYAAPEVGRAFERAAEICRHIGTDKETFVVVGGLYVFCLVRSDHRRAHEFARELLEIASRERDDALTLDAHFALGTNLYWQGKFIDSIKHLELALSGYRPNLSLVNFVGSDTLAFAFAYASAALWQLGYPDRSLEMCVKAHKRVHEVNDQYTAAVTRLSTITALLLRKDRTARDEAETLIAISTEHGYEYVGRVGTGLRNCALLEERPTEEAVENLLEIVEHLKKEGAIAVLPLMQGALAEAHGRIAKPAAGLSIIADALAQIEKTWEHQMEAELYRIRGELLLVPDAINLDEAERAFRTSIAITQEQSAKSWELRATKSLARLLAKQGHRNEARATLADIYNWFTEGFDTADLKDAKALLDELDGAGGGR